MAVIRQMNWLSQQRVDVPHARMIEFGVCGDFDALAGNMIAGKQPLVVRGFTIDPVGIGGQASALTIDVSNGALIHYGASDSGSIFSSPATASTLSLDSSSNALVVGGFTAGATNYIGVDLSRVADDDTADKLAFLVPATETETYQTADLAKSLTYKFVISTQFFSANSAIVPIAKVVVGSSGIVTSIEDTRPMLFRLGSGGDTASASNVYSFPAHRTENAILSSSTSVNPFAGSDKSINSMKEWQDAVMTRLWELGGGEHWYSPSNPRDWYVVIPQGTATFSNTDYVENSGGNLINTKALTVLLDNSTAKYNTVAAVTGASVADGQVLYVTLDRANNGASLTAAVSDMDKLYVGASPGNRIPLVWRRGSYYHVIYKEFILGQWPPVSVGSLPIATPSNLGLVQLSAISDTPATPKVVTYDSTGVGLVTTGIKSTSTTYAFRLLSDVADAFAANGVLEVTSNNVLTGGLLLNLRNSATSKFTVGYDGVTTSPKLQWGATYLSLNGGVGSTTGANVGVKISTNATYTDASARILELVNGTTKAYVDKDGAVVSSASISATTSVSAGTQVYGLSGNFGGGSGEPNLALGTGCPSPHSGVPIEGEVWYDSTAKTVKARIGTTLANKTITTDDNNGWQVGFGITTVPVGAANYVIPQGFINGNATTAVPNDTDTFGYLVSKNCKLRRWTARSLGVAAGTSTYTVKVYVYTVAASAWVEITPTSTASISSGASSAYATPAVTTTNVSGSNASTNNILVASSAGFLVGDEITLSTPGTRHTVTSVPDGTHVSISPAAGAAPTTGTLARVSNIASLNQYDIVAVLWNTAGGGSVARTNNYTTLEFTLE